jgi:hypothetical protein
MGIITRKDFKEKILKEGTEYFTVKEIDEAFSLMDANSNDILTVAEFRYTPRD